MHELEHYPLAEVPLPEQVVNEEARIIGLVDDLTNPSVDPELRDLAEELLILKITDMRVQWRIFGAFAETLEPDEPLAISLLEKRNEVEQKVDQLHKIRALIEPLKQLGISDKQFDDYVKSVLTVDKPEDREALVGLVKYLRNFDKSEKAES